MTLSKKKESKNEWKWTAELKKHDNKNLQIKNEHNKGKYQHEDLTTNKLDDIKYMQ